MSRTLFILATVGALNAGSIMAEEAPTATQRPVSSPQCTEYIKKGEWVYRYNEWTLSLTPTACGRQIDASETAYMFYEIAKKFSGSPYWHNSRGVINQLTCHLAIAREKPEWNLDPWRPYVGHSETVRQGCNPTAPEPDKPFH